MAFDFNDARMLDGLCYDLIEADWARGRNRALINSLANGDPPYTSEEAEENKIKINVNDLTLTRVLHDGRSQFANAFLTSGQYFTATTDTGPIHKRDMYSKIVTKEANNILKQSIQYYETMRSKFALLVLHGISPTVWENPENPIPKPLGVEDVLIPSGTTLGFDNLPYIVLRRSFTARELQALTFKKTIDPGWNIPFVKRCLGWLDSQMVQLSGQRWPEMWSAEKWEERSKEDGGFYATDRVPTLDCLDIYGYVEATADHPEGWVRRIILDSWSQPEVGTSGGMTKKQMKDKDNKDLAKPGEGDFLYNSSLRKKQTVGDSWQQIIAFQYADLSAVAPFRYHSVRSLGWLLYSACHLQNRMTCKFNEAVFESLLQYFKVGSMEDVQRALKLELANMGIIDETIKPVPAAERWQPNAGLVELGLQTNRRIIDENSQSYTQSANLGQNNTEKTKFEVMAKVQQANALVGAALNQAHEYQGFEYREIFRRLMRPASDHPTVRQFRARCLAQGVPEKLIASDCAWNVQSERMMGGGNQTLEMLIAEQLMNVRPLLDPQPQRIVLRDAILAWTKNPAKSMELVPEVPEVSNTVHDTELAFGAMMNGTPVTPKSGVNAVEAAAVTVKLMGAKVGQTLQSGGVGTPQDLAGYTLAAKYAQTYIQQIAQDKQQAPVARKLSDELGKVMNEVKGLQQRQQEAAKAAQSQQPGGDPAAMAKVQATILAAKTKAKIASESHAQKTAQRQIQFEQSLKQKAQQHQADLVAKDLETAGTIRRKRLQSVEENEAGK